MTVAPESMQQFKAVVGQLVTHLRLCTDEINRLASEVGVKVDLEGIIDQVVAVAPSRGAAGALTINAIIDEYRAEHAAIGRRSKGWESHAREFLRRWDGLSMQEVLKPANVGQYVAWLRETGKAPQTIKCKLNILSNLCRVSTELGQPVAFPKRLTAAIRVHNERTRVLSKTERRRLQVAMSPGDWEVVTIAIKTGMRSQELFGLLVEDCDFAAGTIHIRKTKTDQPRKIPMVGEVRAVLARAARSHSEYATTPPGYDNWKNRSSMADHWKGKIWRPALAAAGIEDFTFHDLRHCATTAMIEAGADPVSVAKIMGWKSTQFLMRYTNLGMATLAKAASKA